MNVRRRPVPAYAIAGALIALLLVGCGRGQTTVPSADADATAIPQPTARSAYAIAVSGSAQVHDSAAAAAGSSSTEIEPGAVIDSGRRITVSIDSHVDIQFGDRGMTRVYGPAEAIVRTRVGAAHHPVMEIDIIFGSIAATVGRLTDSDVYRVRTPRAFYVVHGTRFYVRSERDDDLWVEEGRVAVYPRSVDMLLLRQTAIETEPLLREHLDELERSVPVFGPGSHARLDATALARSEALASGLTESMGQVAAATVAQRESVVSGLIDAIRTTAGAVVEIANAVPGTSAPPASIEQRITSIGAVRLLPVPDTTDSRSLFESDTALQFVQLTVRTLPQNAEIFLDGVLTGSGAHRTLLRANENLSIRVARQGYRERRIQVDRARTEVITVQLERLPPSISTDSFLKAVAADDIGTVRTYVTEGGPVNVRNADGIPAVILATGLVPALQGLTPDLSYDREVLRTLVAAGASMEDEFLIEGSTFKPLHAAVLAGVAGFDVSDLLAILLGGPADVNGVVVLEGQPLTPLAIAVRWALFTGETQEEIIKRLLTAGARLDVTISFNNELLTLREIANRLMRQGAIEDQELMRLLRTMGAGA